MGSFVAESGPSPSHSSSNDSNLKGTISEAQVFGNAAGQSNYNDGVNYGNGGNSSSIGNSSPSACPKCGYPLGRGMNVCPQCGTPLQGASQQFNNQGPNNQPNAYKGQYNQNGPQGNQNQYNNPGQHYNYNNAQNAHLGTVNPWQTPQAGNFCTLKPLAWDNENTQHNAITYSGEAIPLNRANTDPNNQTITSKQQAELTFENGDWYICDKSSQKTTYVYAGRKTKIEKGDIIILGNRQFEFNC